MPSNAPSTTASSTHAPTPLRVMPTTFGHTMPLTAEEFPLYHLHITHFFTEHRPHGDRECNLVQRIADNEWRIDRIARLEMGIYAMGKLEFGHLYADQDPTVRPNLIQTHTHKANARQLSSLGVQESRLRRYVEKDLAELRQLQADRLERQTKEAKESKAPAVAAATALATGSHENGFEFATSSSTPQAASTTADLEPQNRALAQPSLPQEL